MKKLFSLSAILFGLSLGSFANPMIENEIRFNELYFGDNEFKLELKCLLYQGLDSIAISSTSATEMFTEFPFSEEQDMWVLSTADFSYTFDLKMEGDTLRVKTYWSYEGDVFSGEFMFAYSNKESGGLYFPSTDYSIAYYMDWIAPQIEQGYYAIGKGHSIGEENEFPGPQGTLKGKIYDFENETVSNYSYLRLANLYVVPVLETNSEGQFCIDIPTANFSISSVVNNDIDWLDIEKMEFLVLEDDTLEMDIHITSPVKLVSAVEKVAEPEMKIMPNPASDFITLQYPNFSGAENYSITDVWGRIVEKGNLTGQNTKVNLGPSFTAGMYWVNIYYRNKTAAREQFLVNPF
jgi:hypothetical protein